MNDKRRRAQPNACRHDYDRGVGGPIIAFITDFGTRDHYVGAMKGAALSICPDATLVDITHDVAPQDVLEGALELAAAYRYFPPATIFVAVVDPGVGSTRRAIAADAAGFRFVAPDNGILTLVLRDASQRRVVELREARYAREVVSRTFEGRDRFAPAAAWLATGIDIGALGPDVHDPRLIDLPRPRLTSDALTGTVLRVDRFGNLLTNIDRRALETFAGGAPVIVTASHHAGRVVNTYADVAPGALCAIVGSSDHLEVAVNGGSAAAHTGLGRGAAVVITRRV
jgi:S-adenosylmethionine hydrolase